jgi:multimeric flavodoxin WrbA
VKGVKPTIYQVQETLSPEILKQVKAPPKANYPVIKPEDLANADGFMFGVPTRFGMMPSQVY